MTQTDPDEFAKSAAIDFARHLVRHWQEELGTDLLGAYLMGSLAHAGFSRRYSDIDIALVRLKLFASDPDTHTYVRPRPPGQGDNP